MIGSSAGTGLEDRFAEVWADWRRIAGDAVSQDERRFAVARAEADALADSGRWVSGPGDLLSVIGRQRDELVHSRLLAWLLNPTGRHALGRSFLRAFIDEAYPREMLAATGPVVVELEVTGRGADGDGDTHQARADIVLRADDVTLVIENKVDAGEQPDQCERLYWSFIEEASDVRWIFLSPTGRAPASTTSERARLAWRPLAYQQVTGALDRVMSATGDRPLDPGRQVAMQYLATLRRNR